MRPTASRHTCVSTQTCRPTEETLSLQQRAGNLEDPLHPAPPPLPPPPPPIHATPLPLHPLPVWPCSRRTKSTDSWQDAELPQADPQECEKIHARTHIHTHIFYPPAQLTTAIKFAVLYTILYLLIQLFFANNNLHFTFAAIFSVFNWMELAAIKDATKWNFAIYCVMTIKLLLHTHRHTTEPSSKSGVCALGVFTVSITDHEPS